MGFFDLGLGPISDVLKDLIQLFPTAEQRAAAASKIQDAQAAISAQQAAIDTAEAGNTSLFVSGWRPFIGWVCGFGFVYSIVGPVFHLPAVDTSNIVSILAGMLGLGTMRTVEKLNNLPPTIRKK